MESMFQTESDFLRSKVCALLKQNDELKMVLDEQTKDVLALKLELAKYAAQEENVKMQDDREIPPPDAL